MLREMLTGERGGTGGGSASRVPHPAGRVLASLLAEDPASRPRSARSALVGIEAARRAIGPSARHRRIAVVSAIALALAAALLLRERPQPGTPAVTTIAVLPFADMSPHHDRSTSPTVSREILNALARVEGLRVVGRTSSF